MQSIAHARIHFNPQGTPVATDFDDIYFSNEGGLAETDYVFLHHNGLPQRWPLHPARFFHIIETGFGTGANFLATWQRFKAYRARYPQAPCQRLYFTSFEKYPLSLADLTQALQCHTELKAECEQLLHAYPAPVSGCHRLIFEQGHIVLDLWLGDVNTLLPQLPAQNKVDAIFLDGFAPSKNPDMWQPTLFQHLFRLSHHDTTLATFTCAGMVKRGLLDAGFIVKKVKGFGRKREMLLATPNIMPSHDAAITTANMRSKPEPITVIGGGLAALCAAFSLVRRGVQVRLLCADADVALGASQNRQGALYPNLSANISPAGLWHCHAFHFAQQFYQQCQTLGMVFPLAQCGLLHLATTDLLHTRQQKMAQQQSWPPNLVRFVDAEMATAIAGIPLKHAGIFIPNAGWLSPQGFCQALYQYLATHPLFSARFNYHVDRIDAITAGWQLHSGEQTDFASQIIVATGADLQQLNLFSALPVNRVRGQVSHVESAELQSLKTVICHKGYLTPAMDGIHSVGATFDRSGQEALVLAADDETNLNELQQQLQSHAWLQQLNVVSAKAAFRATTPDHLPLCGFYQPDEQAAAGIWLLTGLGARGLLFAPLLAELLACQLTDEPLPVAEETLKMLSANRFRKAAKPTI